MTHELKDQIGKLLGEDPVCMGRVCMGTIEAIAALTSTTVATAATDARGIVEACAKVAEDQIERRRTWAAQDTAAAIADEIRAKASEIIAALPDAAAAIRSLPYDQNDDYAEVRRDERERMISALPKAGEDHGSPADDDLARLIETRLLGVHPDSQDLQLEDHDWERIIAALTRPTRAALPQAGEVEPVAVIGNNWQLLWASPDSLKAVVERTGIEIGSKLYATPPSAIPAAAVGEGVRHHRGDPCIHCGTAHDDVASGPCQGRQWHCNACTTEFPHVGEKRPNCPFCKAFDQYTYEGPYVRAALPTPAEGLTERYREESGDV